jgi:hypothetical protein
VKDSISIDKLILDGEEVIFSNAEYIVRHTKVDYDDYHNYKRYGIIKDRRIEVDTPDINVELNKSYIDIEAYCADGMRRGCHGLFDEFEATKSDKTIRFGIQIMGNVNEHSLA